jgi:multidrug efflux pump
MSFSEFFVARPVGTALLTIGLALAGFIAFFQLPVAPLPQVDFPTIAVTAQLPGASPETVAKSVANPLEHYLGRIAHVTEMTSTSSPGQARIVLQFDIDRDIDGAARDVQAAINAARSDLPSSLPYSPTYRKLNPAEMPVLILILTSTTLTPDRVYDLASNFLQLGLSQLDGVGQVVVGGASPPAVRIELNPKALFKYGLGPEDVRAALVAANANGPKGEISNVDQTFQIYTNDQATRASDYLSLIVGYRNGAPIHLSEIAEVEDSVEDLRNECLANGEKAVAVYIYRQPGANLLATVERVKAELPKLAAAMPSEVAITLKSDRSNTIRASLRDTEWTLVVAVLLVTLVVFLFLRNVRATLIPAVVTTVSIVATFGVMWLLGFSLNNFSLMALIVATGFVVDDAIVVLENISRHIDNGMGRLEASVRGAREVAFTVLSMSVSLIAVFVPILFMGGMLGRLFREFAVTLSVAVLVSLVLSLTTTPMLCARFLRAKSSARARPRCDFFAWLLDKYARSLNWSLRHGRVVILILISTVGLNLWLFSIVPKDLFPQEDTGRLAGAIRAEETVSFQFMRSKLAEFEKIIRNDPAVESVSGVAGSAAGQNSSASVFVDLKPTAQRSVSADEVIARLRGRLAEVPGARLFLRSVQDLFVGGRPSDAQYQFTLQGDNVSDLYDFAPRLVAALQRSSILTDVDSDMEDKGLETNVAIDRDTASRLGVTTSDIDNTLYDAFGQRQVSVIYSPINQYHVVMEVEPRYWQDPTILNDLYVGASSGAGATGAAPRIAAQSAQARGSAGRGGAGSNAINSARNATINAPINASGGKAPTGEAVSTRQQTMTPMSAFSHIDGGAAPTAIYHQGLFAAITISFNLNPGRALGEADQEIRRIMAELQAPATLHGSLEGTAGAFADSLGKEPLLILAALAVVYIVLGVLYESFIHPITILSTLPSAGVGAVLALMLFGVDFSVIALIGVILLIGIVKKNAILMIDFALEAERSEGLVPRDAIFRASVARFRPIMMTTLVAIFGAVPLALSFGDGGEIRRPLGISVVGGLVVSQLLTLYTTPIVYLYLENFRSWSGRRWRRFFRRRSIIPSVAHRKTAD